MKQKKIIGRRKYDALKRFDLENLNEDSLERFAQTFKIPVGQALKDIEAYENHFQNEPTDKGKEYLANLMKPKEVKDKPLLTKEILWNLFLGAFLVNEGIKFKQTDDAIENIKPLIYYYTGDFKNFEKCKNVLDKSKPSLKKGLLVVGDYGNGKSSMFRAFETVLKRTNIIFKGFTANEVVMMYEGCKNSKDKEEFFNLMYNGTRYFDDVKTERVASNYGKSDLFKDILETRYNNKVRTYITCNYNDGFPNDLNVALKDFGVRYGNRVFDRLFEMFNVIVFTGPSFRK